MSGSGNGPGQQGWIWNESWRDYYWRDPNTGQYWLQNGGNYRAIPTTPNQQPRREQNISRSEIRNSSRPSIAGSPPGDTTPYTLHGPSSQPWPRRGSSSSYPSQSYPSAPGSSSSAGAQSDLARGISRLNVTPHRPAEYFDERSGVRSVVNSGNVRTDPTLEQESITAHMHILGTEGDKEALYPDFRIRPKPRTFFTVGKVFKTLWAEPAGDSGKSNATLITSEEQSKIRGKYGEFVFSKVRRFIVIRESDNYCSALSIVSYGDQGAAKHGVIKHEHGIVYTGKQAPQPSVQELSQRGEGAGMVPIPIRVDPDQKTEKLNVMSRINYGKVYTVEHNVKVKSLGTVSRESLQALIYQFRNVWHPGVSRQRGLNSIPEQGPSNSRQSVDSSPQGDYNSAYRALLAHGWTPAQADAVLKQRGKAGTSRENPGSADVEEEDASSDEAEEEADSDDEGTKTEKAKQAFAKWFHDSVHALHQQGHSYEEAERAVRAQVRMSRSRTQIAASTSQSGSAGRRRAPRDNEHDDKDSNDDSSEESSDDDEEEEA